MEKNNNLHLTVYDLQQMDETEKQYYSETISEITHVSEFKMVKLSVDEVSQKDMKIVVDEDGSPIAFAGYAAPEFNQSGQEMAEIGSMFTADSHRNLGIATMLLNQITQDLLDREITPYVFGNNDSAPLFIKNGYDLAITKSQLPEIATKLCEGCDHYPLNKTNQQRANMYLEEISSINDKIDNESNHKLLKVLNDRKNHLTNLIDNQNIYGKIECCDMPLMYKKGDDNESN